MKTWAALILGAALIAGCAKPGESFQKGDITIDAVMISPPMGGKDVTAAYFTIHNKGAADRLLSADSPAAATVEIHTHEQGADGVMRMRRVDGVDTPAGDTTFRPGGLHLMMFGVTELEPKTLITLHFRDAGDVAVQAEARAPTPGMEHEH